MTYGQCRGAEASVWIVLSERAGAYGELADALRASLDSSPGPRINAATGTWDDLREGSAGRPSPRLVVTVGLAALKSALADSPGRAPVLALLVPSAGYSQALREARAPPPTSAVVLDQPPARQLALLRGALPAARRAGLLVGTDNPALAASFEAAARSANLALTVELAAENEVGAALQRVLAASDVLIAAPDAGVVNSRTIAGILTAGYRQKVPLLGYSPALVRAGALLGLYSTPQQIAAQGADVVRRVLAGTGLPPVRPPDDFSVQINASVARSFGLTLDGDMLARELRRMEKLP